MNVSTAQPATSLTAALHIARDIKLSHSLFALPFALLAMFLAAGVSGKAGRLPAWWEVALIVGCMVLARTVAMTVNRWADRKLDAKNPRTQGRAIPSGRLSAGQMLIAAIACGIGFELLTLGFWVFGDNPWPTALGPLVLAWLCFYSFAKRFTALCHVILGIALALSPIAAAIAIEPSYLQSPVPWLLAGMVTAWVAGFDIIYSLQDVDVDQSIGLFSLPSRLGVEPALWVSRGLHLLVFLLLSAMLLLSPQLGIGFAFGVGLTGCLLIVEHYLIITSPERHLNMAFFTVNGVISVLLGGLGIVDVVLV